MSFILDALKKSENDRQRQSGPALFEVRVAPPKSRFPMWAIAVVALLAVNLSVIGWLMLRRPATAAEPAAPPPQVAATVPPTQIAPAPVAQQPVATAPAQSAPALSAPGVASQVAANLPQQESVPLQSHLSQNPAGTYPTAPVDERAAAAAINPDDYEPAKEPAAHGPFGEGHVTRGTESGLPMYDEEAGKIGIPPLRLDLHVYDPNPAKRFVLVNMKRLNEGQSTPDGVKVESITPDTVILSYRGSKFVLDRD